MNTSRFANLHVCILLSGVVGATVCQSAFAQIGACCLGTGGCIATTSAGCSKINGDYIGDDSDCADVVCIGACCMDSDECEEINRDDCVNGGGEYRGPGSACLQDCPTRVGTSFSYQGQLKDDGRPLTGAADFRFSLWRSATGNEQIGSTLVVSNVDVVKGLFTLDLDFGIEVFDGSTRWLEVEIRSPHDPGDSEPFTVLTSRQRIAPMPYALQTRGIQSDDSERITIGTQESLSRLSVWGNVLVRDDENYGMALAAGDQQGIILWLNPNGSNSVMRIDSTGLGIYRVPQANELEVSGTASKATAGSWLSNSDRRIKKDIQTVENATGTILKINPVSFSYTEAYLKDNPRISDRRYLNVIAQEFAEVFPDYVQGSGDRLADGEEIMQVDTYPLTIYSAAAVKELHARLVESERENQELRRRIEAIEKMLNPQPQEKK